MSQWYIDNDGIKRTFGYTLEEIEERLNLPYYVPPSKRGYDPHDIGQECPYCGVTNTYFSCLFMCHQCNKCDGLFSLQDVWDKEKEKED